MADLKKEKGIEKYTEKMAMMASKPGCTAWPEGDWHHCCVAHDYDYADDAETLPAKFLADLRLRRCVESTGHPIIAEVMFLGVSTLGIFAWLKYRRERGR